MKYKFQTWHLIILVAIIGVFMYSEQIKNFVPESMSVITDNSVTGTASGSISGSSIIVSGSITNTNSFPVSGVLAIQPCKEPCTQFATIESNINVCDINNPQDTSKQYNIPAGATQTFKLTTTPNAGVGNYKVRIYSVDQCCIDATGEHPCQGTKPFGWGQVVGTFSLTDTTNANCVLGETKCYTTYGYKTCVLDVSTNKKVWSQVYECTSGSACTDGQPINTVTGECGLDTTCASNEIYDRVTKTCVRSGSNIQFSYVNVDKTALKENENIIITTYLYNSGNVQENERIECGIYADSYAKQNKFLQAAGLIQELTPTCFQGTAPFVKAAEYAVATGSTEVATFNLQAPNRNSLLGTGVSNWDSSFSLICGIYQECGQAYKNKAGVTSAEKVWIIKDISISEVEGGDVGNVVTGDTTKSCVSQKGVASCSSGQTGTPILSSDRSCFLNCGGTVGGKAGGADCSSDSDCASGVCKGSLWWKECAAVEECGEKRTYGWDVGSRCSITLTTSDILGLKSSPDSTKEEKSKLAACRKDANCMKVGTEPGLCKSYEFVAQDTGCDDCLNKPEAISIDDLTSSTDSGVCYLHTAEKESIIDWGDISSSYYIIGGLIVGIIILMVVGFSGGNRQ